MGMIMLLVWGVGVREVLDDGFFLIRCRLLMKRELALIFVTIESLMS